MNVVIIEGKLIAHKIGHAAGAEGKLENEMA